MPSATIEQKVEQCHIYVDWIFILWVSNYLKNDKLWCHAKNIEALNKMSSHSDIHCFWHQEDDVTLTSRNFLWTYSGKKLTENSVAVLPELNNDNALTMLPKKLIGICSDYIVNYKM